MQLPPPLPLTNYEKEKIARLEQNAKVFKDLGIKKLVGQMKTSTANTGKGKEKAQEECDDYIPENEDEDESDDTTEV